jgi:MoCo/4Fe-4S cofactor protein with predicted Tat translocation signal
LGKEYWRSLDELADTPEFRRMVESEFPSLADDLVSPGTRRHFLKLMGASLAMAGLASCRWPKERIMPFAHRPVDSDPGHPLYFATAMELGGSALGLLVKSYDGRPIKVEGNPLHPDSLGAAHAWAQASVLGFYDPERSRSAVRREGGQRLAPAWDDFLAFARSQVEVFNQRRGKGLAVLSEATSSPTVMALRDRFLAAYPEARWVVHEALARDSERLGSVAAFGRPYRTQLHLDRARVIVALDSDLLDGHPAALRHARQFAAGRQGENGAMNRLYAAEPLVTLTGAAADHRLAVPRREVANVALLLAARLAGDGVELPVATPQVAVAGERVAAFAGAAARDLAAARGAGVVAVGPSQPPAVHALAHMLNAALGNLGATVTLTPEELSAPAAESSLAELTAAMRSREVDTLLILGGNPAYDAPADAEFGLALEGCPTAVHLGLHDDETSARCRWHLPRAHFLEAWGDARAWDGTVSLVQPLIEPLYGGKTAAELLSVYLGEPTVAAHELTRRTFRAAHGDTDFEERWRRALSDGVVEGSATAAATPSLTVGSLAPAVASLAVAGRGGGRLEAVFHVDASVYDGRFANNAWLQELPDPVTKVAWDNAATLSPEDAARLRLRHGDVVTVASEGRTLDLPVYLVPGQAEGTVGLALGYGRLRGGKVAEGAGFDTYRLRTGDALYRLGGVSVHTTGDRLLLVTTQDHHAIDTVGFQARSRRIGGLIREATLAEFVANPAFAKEGEEPGSKPKPLWKELQFTGEHQWGMAIDLSSCIGCSACTVACQAENNIPVVGKRQVAHGREMHWIRVDRYFSGPPEAPNVRFEPMACQQCENAPCESVCPVAATVHSQEGLNQMVYNRCVGTRYCSNNCPYKVRRFNFFNYFLQVPQVEKMMYNPEVTIRARGVMEKCTFCIQRIEAVKIAAKNDRRPITDGEIVPACAQTCPTQAIVFGDLKDPASRVSRLHRDPRAYGILDELFTSPRNRYLAKLTNPSDELRES